MGTGNVIWLASYPKTGSTWLKEIVNQVLTPEMSASASIPSFQKSYPSEAPIHEFQGTSAKIVKTHFYPENPRMTDCRDICVGIISIYRHPLDILLSALNYSKIRGKEKYFKENTLKSVEDIIRDGEISYYVSKFMEEDGISIYHGTSGRWSEYQPKWDNYAQGKKYLRLCYEKMVQDPAEAVRLVHTFFGLSMDEAHNRSVIEATESRTALNGKFFWKKKAYNFQDMLPASLIQNFYRAYQDELAYLGYNEVMERAS